jgi:predicted nuclease with RNAse H fold
MLFNKDVYPILSVVSKTRIILISKQMAENVTGTNGPNTIQKRITLQDGVPIARQVYWSLLRSSISVFPVFRAKFAELCMHSIQVAPLVVFRPSGH